MMLFMMLLLNEKLYFLWCLLKFINANFENAYPIVVKLCTNISAGNGSSLVYVGHVSYFLTQVLSK